MKQILVTGGTGYIGSHTTVELQNAGYEVVIVDNFSNSSIGVLNGIEQISGIRPAFEQFDLIDKEKVYAFFEKYPRIEAIIHFAAFKAVGESVANPIKYYRNNLTSLVNILDAMEKYSVTGMVFSSSCTVYGQPEQLPVTEQAPVVKANSPYGNTKQISEEIIQDTLLACPKLKAIALRYFNPVGAHPTALIGELPLGVPQNLVPFITQAAAGLRKQLNIFGSDYNTPDGTAIRDYIHVVDLAKAHVTAVGRLIESRNKEAFEVFNLGTGTGLSVLEVVQSFERVSGQKLNYVLVDRRPGDVEKVYADTSFANDELGWKAESSLDDILSSALKWEKRIRGIE
jgi:UDP-glucose 4-epimerase